MPFEISPQFIAQLELGEEIVRHIFHVPTPRDWQEFCARRFRGGESTIVAGMPNTLKVNIAEYTEQEMNAANALWESCIDDVEGYIDHGEPLKRDVKGWKSKVWMPHRIAAVNQLINFYNEKKEEIEKN